MNSLQVPFTQVLVAVTTVMFLTAEEIFLVAVGSICHYLLIFLQILLIPFYLIFIVFTIPLRISLIVLKLTVLLAIVSVVFPVLLYEFATENYNRVRTSIFRRL